MSRIGNERERMRREPVKNFRAHEPQIQNHTDRERRVVARRRVAMAAVIVLVSHRAYKVMSIIVIGKALANRGLFAENSQFVRPGLE
jgi:membrane glycosyltransferase